MSSNKDEDKTQHWLNYMRTVYRDNNSNLKLLEQLL